MKYFLSFFMLSCFLFSRLEGQISPKPISGTPFIISPRFSMSSGSFTFEISIPSKWGVGDMSANPDGSAHFELYPVKGGYGCMIETQIFDSNDEAVNKLNKTQKKFKNTKDLEDGFEAELSHAWFSCRLSGRSLIQTWYSLPLKSSGHKRLWKNLKNCIQVYNVEDLINEDPESRKLINKTMNGWIFNHPTKKQGVYYKDIISNGKQRENDSLPYLITIDDFSANAMGYFFIEWDQMNLDTEDPYRDFANKIYEGIMPIKFNAVLNPIEIFPKKGYAIRRGYPYSIVVVAGDDFLFGFAVKYKVDVIDMDVTSLINKVQWTPQE